MKKKAYHGVFFWNKIGDGFNCLSSRKKVINADVLDAPFPPDPKIRKMLKRDMDWLIRTSPPTHSEGLKQTISKVRHIPVENILVSGGSSDLIFSFFSNYLNNRKRNNNVLILDPMYGEYQHILETVLDLEVHRHYLKEELEFTVDFNLLRKNILEVKPSIVVLVNPNSPTGKYFDSKHIENLVEEFTETCFVVDETYVDYLDKKFSVETKVKNYENLVIIKSMSKVYALSGLRVGYLVAPETIIDKISPYIAPWSVGLFGQIAGVIALQNEKYYTQQYKKVLLAKQKMLSVLTGAEKKGKIKIFDSCANFFLLRLVNESAKEVVAKLTTKNIFIRNCDSVSKQFQDNFIRIAVKDSKSNRIVVKELLKLIQ